MFHSAGSATAWTGVGSMVIGITYCYDSGGCLVGKYDDNEGYGITY